jgi:hypothetical protein
LGGTVLQNQVRLKLTVLGTFWWLAGVTGRCSRMTLCALWESWRPSARDGPRWGQCRPGWRLRSSHSADAAPDERDAGRSPVRISPSPASRWRRAQVRRLAQRTAGSAPALCGGARYPSHRGLPSFREWPPADATALHIFTNLARQDAIIDTRWRHVKSMIGFWFSVLLRPACVTQCNFRGQSLQCF